MSETLMEVLFVCLFVCCTHDQALVPLMNAAKIRILLLVRGMVNS